ncbi:MAG TPA: glycosyltransferase family 1 protein [Gemmatimonadaceae bacterium]|nr:glycosyltransferase family 1 protein [Gemmatimonadaceae bacterium]
MTERTSRPAVSAAGLRLAIFSDTFSPQVNGLTRTLDRLVPAVEARGGAVRLVTVSDPDAPDDARLERWPSVPFWAYPQLRMAAPLVGRALDLVERWKPTLVHAVTEFGVGLGGLFAARQARVPFVSSYHTHFEQYIRFYRLTALDAIAWPFLRWFHNSGLCTWAPSATVAAELAAQGFRHLRVWSRGVEHERFNPAFRSHELRARLGASDETILVAYVGRLAPEKGIHVALEALRRVRERLGSRVVFALAGDGPAEARCRATAGPGTIFAGRLSGRALSEFYASADLFVMPSTTETFGNVLLEAMASGLAVVAPDAGATTELATRATALQVAARDPAAIAAAVERLAGDAALRRRLAAAALAAARARTWDAVFDALIADYRDVLRAPLEPRGAGGGRPARPVLT